MIPNSSETLSTPRAGNDYITPQAEQLDAIALDAAARLQAKWLVGCRNGADPLVFHYALTREIADALAPAIASAFLTDRF